MLYFKSMIRRIFLQICNLRSFIYGPIIICIITTISYCLFKIPSGFNMCIFVNFFCPFIFYCMSFTLNVNSNPKETIYPTFSVPFLYTFATYIIMIFCTKNAISCSNISFIFCSEIPWFFAAIFGVAFPHYFIICCSIHW